MKSERNHTRNLTETRSVYRDNLLVTFHWSTSMNVTTITIYAEGWDEPIARAVNGCLTREEQNELVKTFLILYAAHLNEGEYSVTFGD